MARLNAEHAIAGLGQVGLYRTNNHLSPFFIVNEHGKRMSWPMLRNRWADAREATRVKAEVENKPDLAN